MPKKDEFVIDQQNPNQVIGTRKTGMDEAAVDRDAAQEDASKRLGAKLKASGGVEDRPPVKGESESMGDYVKRNNEYKKRKQEAQGVALSR